MDIPETRYTYTVDGVAIAYQVLGEGSPSIVFANSAWSSNVEISWEWSLTASLYRGLAGLGTLVMFDRRGAGLSDRVSGDRLPTLEARMDDIRAVMDAVGLERAVLYGLEDGAAVCFLFAATYPERTQAVITSGASSRGMWSPETPWIWTAETWEEEIEETRQGWGTQAFTESYTRGIFPSRVNDQEFVRQYGRVMRQAMGRADAIAASRMWRDTDVEHVLPLIQAPTLVMHYVDDKVEPIETGRYIADHIPGAVLAELPGADHSMGDVAVVDQFLASLRAEEADFDRVLATVMFTDIVDSTALATKLGDHAWRELVERHHATVRALLGRYRGTEMDTAGDGFFATFDGPARGIRCAQAITRAVEPLGIEVRAGLHTGEVELIDQKAGGIAVNIGARICAQATASHVLVSQTVKDLVAGSDIHFEDIGTHQLKGITDPWHLHRATREQEALGTH